MGGIRFIHTADIHLGSVLETGDGPLPDSMQELVTSATFEGFRRVCSLAIEHAVDFVVIAGDLYDRRARSVHAQEFFVAQCLRLQAAGIGVYVLAGNHDALRQKNELFEPPANVFTFSAEAPQVFTTVDRRGKAVARLVGQSYGRSAEKARLHLNYPELPADLWNIGVLHTQLDGEPSPYIPCSLGELKSRGDLHYWALGHIHQRGILHGGAPHIAYPGIPQGRHFKEQGRGGCLLVELGRLQQDVFTFLPTAAVVYKREEIFIDEEPDDIPKTLPELETRLIAAAEEILGAGQDGSYPVQGYLIHWIIRGRSSIHELIAEQPDEVRALLLESLRGRFSSGTPFLWSAELTLRTEPALDLEEVLRGSPVAEELERVIEDCKNNAEVQARLKESLGAIWGGHEDEENYGDKDDFRFPVDDQALIELLAAAKQLILEKLAEGRE